MQGNWDDGVLTRRYAVHQLPLPIARLTLVVLPSGTGSASRRTCNGFDGYIVSSCFFSRHNT